MTVACLVCGASPSDPAGHKDGFHLFRCPDCGFVQVHPWPTDEVLREFYQSYFYTERYLAKLDSKLRRATRRIRRLLRDTRGRRFLDVGCNIGAGAAAAQRLGLAATGIDVDERALEIARRRFPDVTFHHADAAAFAEAGERFDIVYCADILEHVPDPHRFIAAVRDLLAPGGVAYVTAPDPSHWRVPGDLARWDQVCPPNHLGFYTCAALERLLVRHGLRVRCYRFPFKPAVKAVIGRDDG